MALKVPYASTLEFLNTLISGLLHTAQLHLYSNNHTPADGDTVANYTECTFPGYAAITLGTWASAALDGSNRASTDAGTNTFTGGAIITPQNIYGIYVTDISGNLLYAELNPAGVVSMAVAGQTYSYKPILTLQSVF